MPIIWDKNSNFIDISDESYFSEAGGFAIIYSGNSKMKVIKDCVSTDNININVKLPYKYLNPLQTAFYLFWNPDESKNILCVAPTSAGKTGLIYLFFLRFKGRKIYLAPTRALCQEKYEEFSKIFGKDAVSIRTGDRFEFSPPDTEYVVATYESCLASIRAKSPWFYESDAVCIDESHFLMFGAGRGVFLEEIIAHTMSRGKWILSLSATIPKSAAEEYAQWLKAKIFYSEWRPVPLERHIESLHSAEKRRFGTALKAPVAERLARIIIDTAKSQKVLIFVYKKSLGWEILKIFDSLGYGVLNETVPFEKKTKVYDYDSAYAAFHNADIPFEERIAIEEHFRNKNLRFLISTQTMAYGVNLPADEAFIVVRNWMAKTLPDTSTILQMEGRVGRFGISKKGISRIITLQGENILKKEIEKFFDSPDTRTSLEKLIEGDESERRIRDIDAISLLTLGIIISNDIDLEDKDRAIEEVKEMLSYMKTSFSIDIRLVIDMLEDIGCIRKGKVTPLGRLLASSLIPPSSYREFNRRFRGIPINERMNSIAYIIRPLLFFHDFTKGFIDMLPPHLKEDLSGEIEGDFEEEKILDVWMSGKLWFYFRYPPAQFYLRPDSLQLTKVLSQLKFLGFLDLSLDDIMRICLSLCYGIDPKYSLICGIPGIGFVRGNLVSNYAKEKKMTLQEVVKEIKKGKNVKKIQDELSKIMLRRAEFLDPSLRSEWAEVDRSKQLERLNLIEKINKDVQELTGIISSAEEDMLFDEEMARVMVWVRLGKDAALEMKKEDLKTFIMQDGNIA